jgi:hypothetical protein
MSIPIVDEIKKSLTLLLVGFGPIGGFFEHIYLIKWVLNIIKINFIYLFIYYYLVLKTDFEVAMIFLDSICNTI